MKTRSSGGFTLIELMVVVIIIAALAGMVLPRYLAVSTEAKEKIAKGDLANISVALKMFYLHNDRYPTTDEGLDSLRSKPSGATGWRGPYLEKKHYDPWGRLYQYKCPGARNTTGFDIWSSGQNAQDSSDDITNWDESD